MAEELSEGEVTSTSNDFLRIRYCKVAYIYMHFETNSVLVVKARD